MVLYDSRSLVTRLGVCVQNNLNANLTALRAFYYDVLLLTTAYSACAVRFFLGQFPNMELLLLLLSLYSLLNSLYFPGWWNITLFLTGCPMRAYLHEQARPSNIIQILTATVMKYHVSVDCQESYIFPRGYIFPKRAALMGKYNHKGKYNYLGTTDTWYFIRPGQYLLY